MFQQNYPKHFLQYSFHNTILLLNKPHLIHQSLFILFLGIHRYRKRLCSWQIWVCCPYRIVHWMISCIHYIQGIVKNTSVLRVLFNSIFNLMWTQLIKYHRIWLFHFLFQFVFFFHVILYLYISNCFEILVFLCHSYWFVLSWFKFNWYFLV